MSHDTCIQVNTDLASTWWVNCNTVVIKTLTGSRTVFILHHITPSCEQNNNHRINYTSFKIHPKTLTILSSHQLGSREQTSSVHDKTSKDLSVWEHICEQASNNLHHINRAKLFAENSAMARLRDIVRGWGQLTREIYSNETGVF